MSALAAVSEGVFQAAQFCARCCEFAASAGDRRTLRRARVRCPVHLSIGQEAFGRRRSPQARFAMSTHRSHAHYLAKGGDLNAFLAEIHGKDAGCCAGRGGSMHLIDLEANFLGATPIVGSSLPVGVGAAFGSSMRGEDRVTVVYFGDGATEEGVFSESLDFAALKKLPVIFVCENNLYSVYSPLPRQARGRRHRDRAGARDDRRPGDGTTSSRSTE